MSEWKEPGYLKDLPEELAGSIAKETFEEGMAYEIYLPPGYDDDESRRYRTVYVFTLPGEKKLGQLVEAVDKIIASGSAEPAILVFPQPPPPPMQDGFKKSFADKFVAGIDEKYRTVAERDSRTAAGFGFAAGLAVALATENNEQFSGCAAYSPLMFDAEQAMIKSTFENLKNPMVYYIDWGRFDMNNPHENWDIRDISSQLYELCEKTDGVTVRGGMVNDSADWSSWRNRYMEFLKLGTDE